MAVLLGDFGIPFSCELSYRLNHAPISADVFFLKEHTFAVTSSLSWNLLFKISSLVNVLFFSNKLKHQDAVL